MESFMDLRHFNSAFQTALLFSMLEGLKDGFSFRVIAEISPELIKGQIQTAGVFNINLESHRFPDSSWELRFEKSKKTNHSCCGMCEIKGDQ